MTRAEIWSDVAGPPDGPAVALVHGSMDRSAGLLKLSRRLDADYRVLRYDRRGYGRSVHAGPPYGVDVHVEDLDRLLGGRRSVVVGHSYGGHVGLALAERRPDLVSAVAVYETPLSWLDWWPSTTAGSLALDGSLAAEDAAEQFMRRLVGDDRWERLPARTRAERRREGRAMVGELADLRRRAPWDAARITVPVVAMYGEHGAEHHRRGTEYLHGVLPDIEVVEIAGARHFGPNTHPDDVAAVVARLVERIGHTGIGKSDRSALTTAPSGQSSRRIHHDVAVSDEQQPISMSPGLDATVLPPADPAAYDELVLALGVDAERRRDAVAEVVARHPRFLDGWAALGDVGRDTIERYAAYRVGYHRGLDALRANGWRGSGYVRWSEPTNRGFLQSVAGLGAMAASIGEVDEAERCEQFLRQLDPDGPRRS